MTKALHLYIPQATYERYESNGLSGDTFFRQAVVTIYRAWHVKNAATESWTWVHKVRLRSLGLYNQYQTVRPIGIRLPHGFETFQYMVLALNAHHASDPKQIEWDDIEWWNDKGYLIWEFR
jgi:hypothetical protein